MANSAGRKRVRLSEERIEKMKAGRRESIKNAPRLPNGRIPTGYKYKSLLDSHLSTGRVPTVITGKISQVGNPPLFVRRPQLAKKIMKLIRKGVPITTVCRAVGISSKTFRDWLERGADGFSPEYVRFARRVAKAEAAAEMSILSSLKSHSRGDWRVSAWQLERRWPEHWSKVDRVTADLKISQTAKSDSKEVLGDTVVKDEAARELARKMIDSTEFSFNALPAPEEESEDA